MRLRLLVPLLATVVLGAADFDPGVTTTLGLGERYQKLITGGCDGFMGGFTDRANTDQVRVMQTSCSATANILWPGEAAKLGFQVQNKQDKPICGKGAVVIIRLGLWTSPKEGDFFTVGMRKLEDVRTIPIDVDVAAKGFQDFSLDLNLPETFGGYVILLDLPGHDRNYIASIARTIWSCSANATSSRPSAAKDVVVISAIERCTRSSCCTRNRLCDAR